MIYLGIDDTDNLESIGTGRLARMIAASLSEDHTIYGVTRHQLYVHEDIPYTSHNSSLVIHISDDGKNVERDIFNIAKEIMLSHFIEGSDPGLAVTASDQISAGVVAFGLDAKRTVLTQERARDLARNNNILLEGLGGTEDGVIGTIAGIGLASTKNDGRFVLKDNNRELTGVQPVSEILSAGIDEVMWLDGGIVTAGFVDLEKSPKPSYVQDKGVLFVEERDGKLVALKRD